MIQPLRNYHKNVFLVLGVSIPALFVAGLVARPRQNRHTITTKSVLVAEADWQRHFFIVQPSRNSDGQLAAKIFLTKPLDFPDVLVYSSESAPQGSLPADARLLGKYGADSSYQLPESGFLILYSGARNGVIDFRPTGDLR